MTDREKLITRLNASFKMQYSKRGLLTAQHTADDLISFGVIFATDNNVGRWIPVTERLPDLELVDVKTYDMDLFPCLVCKNMLNPQRKNVVTKAWYDGEGFMDSDCIRITKFVTHWMPLPEAPEED